MKIGLLTSGALVAAPLLAAGGASMGGPQVGPVVVFPFRILVALLFVAAVLQLLYRGSFSAGAYRDVWFITALGAAWVLFFYASMSLLWSPTLAEGVPIVVTLATLALLLTILVTFPAGETALVKGWFVGMAVIFGLALFELVQGTNVFVHYGLNADNPGHVHGPTANRNNLAFSFVLFLLVAWAAAIRGLISKSWLFLAFISASVVAMVTASFLAAAALLIAFLFLFSGRRDRMRAGVPRGWVNRSDNPMSFWPVKRVYRVWVGVLIGIGVGIGVGIGALYGVGAQHLGWGLEVFDARVGYLESILTGNAFEGGSRSGEVRLALTKSAVAMSADSAMLGQGAGSFGEVVGDYELGRISDIRAPHGYFNQLLGELGVVGLLAYGLFVFGIFWRCFGRAGALTFSASLLSYFVLSFGPSSIAVSSIHLWFLVSLALLGGWRRTLPVVVGPRESV